MALFNFHRCGTKLLKANSSPRTRLFFKLLMPVKYLNILLHPQLDPESQQCTWATTRKATSFAHPGRNIGQQHVRTAKARKHLKHKQNEINVAGLAQVEERLSAEREVAGSISGSGPILGVLRKLSKKVLSMVWKRISRFT